MTFTCVIVMRRLNKKQITGCIKTYEDQYPILKCELRQDIQEYRNNIQSAIQLNFSNDKYFKESAYYALTGGKRLRSILLLGITTQFKSKINPIPLALAVEYLHSSALIIDDMPHFDNDNERRNKQTVHYKYGNDVAHLLALQLNCVAVFNINSTLYNIAKQESEQVAGITANLIYGKMTYMMSKATQGQYLDISKKQFKLQELIDLFYMKTATFFEFSTYCAAIISKLSPTNIQLAEQLGKNIGIAYQIYDDINDYESDIQKQKANINIVTYLSLKETEKLLSIYINIITSILRDMGIYNEFWRYYLQLCFQKYIK